ncbi:GNAT family N-acetyltransferase [Falsirhodobacter xinxiangensis]|uniref:GNAT family N-acetyltransferase n=1 Tax=Falsirhodobacter xinxiangensis TaxID=2530049 RepID=UPI0010A9D268|nr:GNAT family N-acetyltransferase [Rhodobacter xinxiangensis]
MPPLIRGRYTIRTGEGASDLRRAQTLRTLAFGTKQLDSDAHDALCTHLLVEDGQDLVACLRLMTLEPQEIEASYSAQFYDLSGLKGFPGPLVEMGRFCIAPDRHDPDILRAAWAAVTGLVDGVSAQLLFGCSSFHGTDPAPYGHAFAALARSHIVPEAWRPGIRAPEVHDFVTGAGEPDMRQATQTLPPLLRTYLAMGGWVSDHAVIDRAMNTLHVFTGLEIARIPPARARLLRAVSG